MRLIVEQCMVIGEGLLHVLVRRQARALGHAELSCSLALGGGPVGDAVLGDEARGRLCDASAVLGRAHCGTG